MTSQERDTFLQKVPGELSDKYKGMNWYKVEDQALPIPWNEVIFYISALVVGYHIAKPWL